MDSKKKCFPGLFLLCSDGENKGEQIGMFYGLKTAFGWHRKIIYLTRTINLILHLAQKYPERNLINCSLDSLSQPQLAEVS